MKTLIENQCIINYVSIGKQTFVKSNKCPRSTDGGLFESKLRLNEGKKNNYRIIESDLRTDALACHHDICYNGNCHLPK